ncbi:GyrI-like domain-containing protein [Flindersiella endophytica]
MAFASTAATLVGQQWFQAEQKEVTTPVEPTITTLPAFAVVGMKLRGTGDKNEFPRLWDRFMPRSGEIKDLSSPRIAYGVIRGYDPATGQFDYLAGFGVDSADAVPEDMEAWNIPTQTYAVFATTLPEVGLTFEAAYKWLEQSSYVRDDGPEFERYAEDFSEASPRLEVCIPVQKT